MDLKEKLYGKAVSFTDKLSEVVTGSYQATKTGGNTQTIVDKPNIVERLSGKKTETRYDVVPRPLNLDKAEPLPPVETPKFDDPLNPRKENLVNKVRAKVENIFSNKEPQSAAVVDSLSPEQPSVEAPVEPTVTKPKITKDLLVFQESTVGDGLPYIKTNEGTTSLQEVYKTYQPKPVEKPIKRIVINDPKEGTYIIDTPEKLDIANQIKAIADEVAPEYTDYLLKLAQKEGGYQAHAFRGEKDNPGGGDDRGIFQINSKAFPTVTDEMARDIRFSVLWAISLIESANPKKGDNKFSGQEKWMANDAVKRSSITIE